MLGFLIDVLFGTGLRALGRGIGRGLATPRPPVSPATTGVLCAACGTFRPFGIVVCPACGNSAAGPAGPSPADRAQSLAGSALAFTLGGFCCAPLTLIGIVLGFRALARAHEAGRPAPLRAVAALGLGFTTLAIGLAIFAYGMKTRHDHQNHVDAVRARLSGKRSAAALDQRAACDLVEEALLAGLYQGRTALGHFECGGPYEARAHSGSLRGIHAEFTADRFQLTACLARSNRWFVLELADGGDCPEGPWPASPAKTEEGLAAHEDHLRRQHGEQDDDERVRQFGGALETVRRSLAGATHEARSCLTLDVSPFVTTKYERRLTLAAVDLALLGAAASKLPAEDAAWGFLTSAGVRAALDPASTAAARAEAVRGITRKGGPYIGVYAARSRLWPQVTVTKGVLEERAIYAGGEFDGWLIVVDTRDGHAACAAPFAFKNSDNVSFRKNSPRSKETRATEAVVEDFKDEFETAATAALKQASGGRFRLGYKLLE